MKFKCLPSTSRSVPLLVGCYANDGLLRMYNYQTGYSVASTAAIRTEVYSFVLCRLQCGPLGEAIGSTDAVGDSLRFIRPTCSVKCERVTPLRFLHSRVWLIFAEALPLPASVVFSPARGCSGFHLPKRCPTVSEESFFTNHDLCFLESVERKQEALAKRPALFQYKSPSATFCSNKFGARKRLGEEWISSWL